MLATYLPAGSDASAASAPHARPRSTRWFPPAGSRSQQPACADGLLGRPPLHQLFMLRLCRSVVTNQDNASQAPHADMARSKEQRAAHHMMECLIQCVGCNYSSLSIHSFYDSWSHGCLHLHSFMVYCHQFTKIKDLNHPNRLQE
jgi:hypothetical protein